MRETVSTAPRSTLLLHLDKVMLETVFAGAGVCEGVSLACGSERGACLYLARVLSFPDAGAGTRISACGLERLPACAR